MKNYLKLGKYLAYILRHNPNELKIKLDSEGFVDIDILTFAINGKKIFHEEIKNKDIEIAVKNDNKGKFEIKNNKVRALYGHSILEITNTNKIVPPNYLYHGTTYKALKFIMSEGLKPIKRRYVHLSKDIKTVIEVWKRRSDNPAIIIVDANTAYQDGVVFYKGNESTYLFDFINNKYITIKTSGGWVVEKLYENNVEEKEKNLKKKLDKKGNIFVCGDTHGTLDVGKLESLRTKNNLCYDDYLIVCGDCGIIWSKDTLKKHINYFERMKCNVLFIDGNHENFDMLNEYPVEYWNGGKIHKISEHIYHLLRGQIFEIYGEKFLTIGGADSSDREYREEHISWWSDERISYDDINEAKQNLENVNYKVDYVITHTPPTKTLNEFVKILTQCGEDIPYYLKQKIIPTKSSDMLDFVVKEVKYKFWFCGHLHIDEKINKTRILYADVVKIK